MVAAGIALGYWAHLDSHGVDLVGHISAGLPTYGFPHVPAESYLKLSGSAIGIVLVGFAEGLGSRQDVCRP